MKARVLIVDDEKDLCWAIREKLHESGYDAEFVLSGEEALESLDKEKFDLAVLDYKMHGLNGLETLEQIRRRHPGVSVIFITAHGDQNLARKSLDLGASDYVHKPFNLDNLLFRIYRTLKLDSLEREVVTLRPKTRKSFASIVTSSPVMEKVLSLVDRVAPQNVPVLITGETGTGKDVIASAIHYNTYNPRKDRAYLTINCGAIPEPLIESELFGHIKGSFTGAMGTKQGLFEAADGGTLFLDEISSATPALQTKLLRILDVGEFYRIGDTKVRTVNVRIIAASNKDLSIEVRNGNFREDLFHRLKVVHLELPPLRDRPGDIEPLIRFFIDHFNRQMGKTIAMHPDVIEALRQYAWPGNIRELKHFVESLVIMARGNSIVLSDLPEKVTGGRVIEEGKTYKDLKNKVVADFDKIYFTHLLSASRGNVSDVSRKSGLARSYVIRKLAEYDLNPKDFS